MGNLQDSSLIDVFVFHPTCELAVANGTNSFQPNRRLKQFSFDLQVLPVYLMKPGDVLLVDEFYLKYSTDFVSQLPLSVHVMSLKRLCEYCNQGKLHIGHIRPWGWSPALHAQLGKLKQFCSLSFLQGPVSMWSDEYKRLFSRRFALTLLTDFVQKYPDRAYLSKGFLPSACTSEGEVKSLFDKYHTLVLKAPYSASGRGIQIVQRDQWRPFHSQWLNGLLKRQQYIMVEPKFNKKAEMGFQFFVADTGALSFVGTTHFITDSTGQYQGNILGLSNSHEAMEAFTGISDTFIRLTAERLTQLLSASAISQFHRGYLGVDALIFETSEGLKMDPLMEVNLRCTMGNVAQSLEKHFLHDDQLGFMGIHFQPGLPFPDFVKQAQQRYSDFLPLTPVTTKAHFGAWMCLVDDLNEL